MGFVTLVPHFTVGISRFQHSDNGISSSTMLQAGTQGNPSCWSAMPKYSEISTQDLSWEEIGCGGHQHSKMAPC